MQKINATLRKKTFLTPDTVQLDFAWPSDPIPYEAGQFFMVEVVDAAGKVSRAYSVSSQPNLAEGFSLCVKLVENGRASEHFRHMAEGESASFMLPFGHFVAPQTEDHDLLMIATGTGLAPFMSMIPTLLKRGFSKKITLVFGVRFEADLFYVDQLREWEKLYPHFEARIAISRPSETWAGLSGRVTDHLQGFETSEALQNLQVYICGNGDMVKSVKDHFDALGLPKTALHLEQFTPMS